MNMKKKLRRLNRINRNAFSYSQLLRQEQAFLKGLLRNGDKETQEMLKRELTVCIKLIDIVLETDTNHWTPNGLKIYVNTKNYKRFCHSQFEQYLLGKNLHNDCFVAQLRIYKALYLYNKIRSRYLLFWWV